MSGRYENHLNWDAVIIWRYAWPHLDEKSRRAVRAEISRMLNWCLTESLQPDGSFKTSALDDTFGDAMEYGVSFLKDVGLTVVFQFFFGLFLLLLRFFSSRIAFFNKPIFFSLSFGNEPILFQSSFVFGIPSGFKVCRFRSNERLDSSRNNTIYT